VSPRTWFIAEPDMTKLTVKKVIMVKTGAGARLSQRSIPFRSWSSVGFSVAILIIVAMNIYVYIWERTLRSTFWAPIVKISIEPGALDS